MINLEKTKELLEKPKRGPIVVGKKERGLDGRFYRPEYEVVSVDVERNVVQVKNGRGESREFSPENLFTWPGIATFAEKQAWEKERAKRTLMGFIVALIKGLVEPTAAQEVLEAIEDALAATRKRETK